MKVTKTWKGWEMYKLTKKQILKELFVPAGLNPFATEEHAIAAKEGIKEDGLKVFDKPKRCTLTITYEVED